MLGKVLVGILVAAGVFLVYAIFTSGKANAAGLTDVGGSTGTTSFGGKPNPSAPANWGGGGGGNGSSLLSGYTGGKSFNKQSGPVKLADIR